MRSNWKLKIAICLGTVGLCAMILAWHFRGKLLATEFDQYLGMTERQVIEKFGNPASATTCQVIELAPWASNHLRTQARLTVPSTFSVDELKRLPAFAAKLKSSTNEVSAHIRSRLKETTRQNLARWRTPDEMPSVLQQSIIEDLNAIILGPSIWNEARFANVRISPETHVLLGSNPSGPDLALFNRFLLEDAYPFELSSA